VTTSVNGDFLRVVQVAQVGSASGAFADNTRSFATSNTSEAALIAVIAKNIKPGLETFDLGKIEPALASDFELQYVPAATTLLREPRATFLASRRQWTGQVGKVREVAYAIQDVQIDPSSPNYSRHIGI